MGPGVGADSECTHKTGCWQRWHCCPLIKDSRWLFNSTQDTQNTHVCMTLGEGFQTDWWVTVEYNWCPMPRLYMTCLRCSRSLLRGSADARVGVCLPYCGVALCCTRPPPLPLLVPGPGSTDMHGCFPGGSLFSCKIADFWAVFAFPSRCCCSLHGVESTQAGSLFWMWRTQKAGGGGKKGFRPRRDAGGGAACE